MSEEAKARFERWHLRQRELGACRCAECRGAAPTQVLATLTAKEPVDYPRWPPSAYHSWQRHSFEQKLAVGQADKARLAYEQARASLEGALGKEAVERGLAGLMRLMGLSTRLHGVQEDAANLRSILEAAKNDADNLEDSIGQLVAELKGESEE